MILPFCVLVKVQVTLSPAAMAMAVTGLPSVQVALSGPSRAGTVSATE